VQSPVSSGIVPLGLAKPRRFHSACVASVWAIEKPWVKVTLACCSLRFGSRGGSTLARWVNFALVGPSAALAPALNFAPSTALVMTHAPNP